MSAAKKTAASTKRERARVGSVFSGHVRKIVRAMEEGIVEAAGEVLGDEVEEADAHADARVESYRKQCDAEIAKANASIERVEQARVADREAAAEKLASTRAELKQALKDYGDEREKRIKVEAERDRLRQQLGVVRAQVAREEIES